MTSGEVAIVNTGLANIASVVAAFERLGQRSHVTSDARAIDNAQLLVLPGVGAFGAGMAKLLELGLVELLRERVAEGRPLLAICLGMQLLCEESEESPGVAGLGAIPARVSRFPVGVRVPQMGWNLIAPMGSTMLEAAHMYFANSYRVESMPRGWQGAMTEHGGPFVATVQRGAVLACQFHPELSGRAGQRLIGAWLARAGAKEVAAC